jgi:hypothetical protein
MVVLVFGYGCNLETPLRPYLNKVAQFVGEMRPFVVFCGAETEPRKFPGKTEAAVMFEYIQNCLPFPLDKEDVVLCEDSRTTYENAEEAAQAVREKGWEPDQLVVWCEATRALKVDLLVRHFFVFLPNLIGRI